MRGIPSRVDRWIGGKPPVSTWSSLELWQRRAVKTILGVLALVAVTSVLYHGMMIVVEGRSPSFSHSAQVVIETYTGTGYGSDPPWETPIGNAFVSIMDLSTFLLLFIVVPYVFRPVLEEALSPSVPTEVDADDHVVICGVAQQGRRLVDEFEARDVEYVVVAETESETMELQSEGISVIQGDPTSAETLRRARVRAARSVVVDSKDERAASVVLAVRELDEAVRTIVLVEDLDHERHLTYAGADRVLTPRHLLSQRIAERISTEISPTRTDSALLGGEYSMLELNVFEESPICGRTVETVEDTAEGSVEVLGLWQEGSFVESPDRDTVVDEQTVLLVAGREADLRKLEAETYRGRETEPTVVVAGYGIVGTTVVEELQDSAAECVVIDVDEDKDADVVGDVTEEETLIDAGIEDATAFVVAIADDDETILSVLMAKALNSGLDVIVRVNDSANATKVRRAGADYVLSLPDISGRLLAEEVLNEEILSYNRQLKIVRIDAASYVGRTVEEADIGDTDVVVIAVERGDELLTDVSPDFELRDGDHLLVVGSDEAIDDIDV